MRPAAVRTVHVVLVALAAGASSVGCQRYPYDPTKATRAYPSELAQAALVDVQVIPQIDQGTLVLVNATSTSYRDFDLWLNRRYVRRVESLPAGQTITLPVESFWDERGEGPFPGGWFRYYAPTPIVLVQIQTAPDAPFIGLIAKPPDVDRR